MECTSINQAYSVADRQSDAGNFEASRAISFCAHAAETAARHVEKLAWACREKNARKRESILQIVLAEMDAADVSLARLPSREYASAA